MAVERFSWPTAKTYTLNGSGHVTFNFTTTASHAVNEQFSVRAHFKFTKSGSADVTGIYLQVYGPGQSSSNPSTQYTNITGYNEFNISFKGTLAKAVSAGTVYLDIGPMGNTNLIGHLSVDSVYFNIGIVKVKAGDRILAADALDVNQSATQYNKITNSNFTAGDKITASAWNTKWGL